MKSVALVLNSDQCNISQTLQSLGENIDICIINRDSCSDVTKKLANTLVQNCCTSHSDYIEQIYVNGTIKRNTSNHRSYTYIEVDKTVEDLVEEGLKILSVYNDIILVINENSIYRDGAVDKIVSKFNNDNCGFVYSDGHINGNDDTLGAIDVMINYEIPIKNYAVRSKLVNLYNKNPFQFALNCYKEWTIYHIPEYLYAL